MATLERMNLLSIPLPGGASETQQILAVHQSINSAGLWVLLTTTSSRTLVYCTSSFSDARFVLPYYFVYLGSSLNGELFFITDEPESTQPFLYVLHFDPSVGIKVTSAKINCNSSHWNQLLKLCKPRANLLGASTLNSSPLLNDNAFNESFLSSVCVPFHSYRDVLSIRNLASPLSSCYNCSSAIVNAISVFQSHYPYLSPVDAIEFSDHTVALVANDSSIRTLSCGVESRLFACKGSAKPTLVLGRSLFSIDNSLSFAPSASVIVHPSLGLVLASSQHCDLSSKFSQSNRLCVFSLDYTTTSMYCSSEFGSTFVLVDKVVHRDHDLVPMLVHHLDYSQTLFYSSRVDRSVIYFLDDVQIS
ncbi:hypothetical protein I1E95_15755 [Synechococcus sp. CBW1107]|nr:hypothetical protein I1E95_15685 [Synechococcus sp. CBW1107]QPN56495.1 hypothetical protein I1E95_15755 [Synechococcus sp. CBW1107]